MRIRYGIGAACPAALIRHTWLDRAGTCRVGPPAVSPAGYTSVEPRTVHGPARMARNVQPWTDQDGPGADIAMGMLTHLADPSPNGVAECEQVTRTISSGPSSSPSEATYRLVPESGIPGSRRSQTLRDRPLARLLAEVDPPPSAGLPPASALPSTVSAGPRSSRAYGAGDVLACRYRLIEPLGAGGMGSVWRARSLGLDVDFALKLIHPNTEMPRAEERLQKEARAAARLSHPAAVRVFDLLATEAGDPCLVMELLRGTPLSKKIEGEGPLSPLEAVRVILPIVDALAAAHREGVVHRDVKPANVMLVEERGRPVPKLIDFGIAGAVGGKGLSKLTERGMVLGSPVYMAPEQVRADADADERTDVWGVCVTLHEILTGQRAFQAATLFQTMKNVLEQPACRPPALDTQPVLWAILERGLAKEPEGRWPSMMELGRALARWGIERGVSVDAGGVPLAGCWLSGER